MFTAATANIHTKFAAAQKGDAERVMSNKDAERSRVSSELRAGRAVAAGALLAGPLSKRSDWLHTWNKRFCVLTTEALSWHKDSGLEAVSDSRVLRMHSKVHLIAKDGTLCIMHSKDQPAPLWFSAASEPELRVWHRTLRALVDSLDAAARIARVHIHENGSRFSAAPFTELPHMGSRNLREGRLAKPYFVCGLEPQRRPPQPARGGPSGSSGGAGSSRVAPAPPPGVTGPVVVAGVAGEVVMYLFSLPPATAAWNGEQRRAFRELMAAIAAADCPRLLPTLHTDVLPDVGKAAVYRALVTGGSVRDLLHRVADPLAPHGVKYASSPVDAGDRACKCSPRRPPLASPHRYGSSLVDEALGAGGANGNGNGSGSGSDGSDAPAKKGPGGLPVPSLGAAPVKKGPQPLPPHLIANFGRQILEGLAALRCLGLPYPHLHCGNVFLDVQEDGSDRPPSRPPLPPTRSPPPAPPHSLPPTRSPHPLASRRSPASHLPPPSSFSPAPPSLFLLTSSPHPLPTPCSAHRHRRMPASRVRAGRTACERVRHDPPPTARRERGL